MAQRCQNAGKDSNKSRIALHSNGKTMLFPEKVRDYKNLLKQALL
ncbi:hypothetical protein [Candidatus Albibeggiatoa sp. nov. NOAA]|nr:hypothetical protein [Thiotrichaceae bacterium]